MSWTYAYLLYWLLVQPIQWNTWQLRLPSGHPASPWTTLHDATVSHIIALTYWIILHLNYWLLPWSVARDDTSRDYPSLHTMPEPVPWSDLKYWLALYAFPLGRRPRKWQNWITDITSISLESSPKEVVIVGITYFKTVFCQFQHTVVCVI